MTAMAEWSRSNLNPSELYFKRLLYYSEFLNGMPKESREPFLSLLPDPVRQGVATASEAQMRAILEGMDDASIVALKDKLLEHYPSLIRDYGGSANDLPFRYGPHERIGYIFLNSLRSQVRQSGNNATALRSSLSPLIVLGYRSSFVSPETMAQSEKPQIDRDSALFKYLCEEGIWSAQDIFLAFCL